MRSPLTALAWEIWHRGRRSARLAVACVFICTLINFLTPERLRVTDTGEHLFNTLFGLLMVMSFLLMMGIFNYTEFNSTREWNGFPYRLFTLPVRTWQLVALPMLLAVASVELLFFAWLKLVWTHDKIPMPEWFAVVFGAYAIFYLTTLWSLAGFRIFRLLVLSFGGVSAVAVACSPLFDKIVPSPWFAEKRMIAVLSALSALAYSIAWGAVARQRSGGGQRRNWIKVLFNWVSDITPRRTKNFSSPAAAQFWFEWRRAGLLLPACTAFVVLVIFAPFSWAMRHNSQATVDILGRILVVPMILSFAIGKAFIKAEFWSMDLALPPFMATRPISSGEFVAAKMKVAALSVALTWLIVLGFIALWLPLWADHKEMDRLMFGFRWIYPHSWQVMTALSFAGLAVLSWRCLVSGLWVGLSGSRLLYIGSICLQVIVPCALLLVAAMFSDTIDRQDRNHPEFLKGLTASVIGWILAILVIIKLWFAVASWKKISPRRTRQYLLLWSAATLCLVILAVLCRLLADFYRMERLFVLIALLLFPFARLGLAPASLAKNRHR